MANVITKKEWLKTKLKGLFGCTICPPNRGENMKRGCQMRRKHKSWKFQTKTEKQYAKKIHVLV